MGGVIAIVDNELQQGKSVIVYQMKNSDKSSEQYADWSSYLNEFMALKKEDGYKAYPADDSFRNKIDAGSLDTQGDYTVFMKNGKPTYFYEGVVVEPSVYVAVDNRYSDKSLTDEDLAFLPEEIKLK